MENLMDFWRNSSRKKISLLMGLLLVLSPFVSGGVPVTPDDKNCYTFTGGNEDAGLAGLLCRNGFNYMVKASGHTTFCWINDTCKALHPIYKHQILMRVSFEYKSCSQAARIARRFHKKGPFTLVEITPGWRHVYVEQMKNQLFLYVVYEQAYEHTWQEIKAMMFDGTAMEKSGEPYSLTQ